MRKTILIMVLVLCSRTSFEQVHEEYVEVMVMDSINIDPEIIDYTLILQPFNEISAFDSATMQSNGTTTVTKEEANNQTEKRNKEIRDLIHKMNIDTLEASNNNVYSMGVFYNNMIFLRFKSKTVFKQFLKEIKKYTPTSGTITSMENSHLEKYYPALFKKIVNQANRNAAFLAAQYNKILGKVIQVKEERMYGGWTSYPPIGALREYDYKNMDNQMIVQKGLTIRYSWH